MQTHGKNVSSRHAYRDDMFLSCVLHLGCEFKPSSITWCNKLAKCQTIFQNKAFSNAIFFDKDVSNWAIGLLKKHI